MIRSLCLAFAIGFATLPACAGPRAEHSGMTTTTAGVVERASPERCIQDDATCLNNSDCCSDWCMDGTCTYRDP
jgi:hypothetical protein